MNSTERKNHWETIYQTKELKDVSWYEPTPSTSLHFFNALAIPFAAKIIDIGGGDSFLVDHLLDLGYTDLTVLDISAVALERAKQRLGHRAENVKWIVADVATFTPTEQYDVWHDRAAFHFLTNEQDIAHYIATIQQSIKPQGALIIGTFSEEGPQKCSGIEIKQYSETTLAQRMEKSFVKVNCLTVDHPTPFQTTQNFLFCCFKKIGDR